MNNRIASLAMIEMLETHHSSGLVYNFMEWINREQLQVVTLIDEDLNITITSYSVKSVLGFSNECMIGNKLIDYIHPDEHEKFYDYLKTLDYTKKVMETRVLHKDGHYIDAQFYSGAIYDDHTNDKYFVVCFSDITEHKKAKEALTNTEKLSSVGQLAASVVHEIRNPLTSIKGFLQLLKNSNDAIKDEYFRVMTESIEKIESITSELLYISKPTTNNIKDEDIVSIVDEVCMLMRSQAIMNDIKLEFTCEMEQCAIQCDRSQIKQVLINLIKNAIEAMPESGTIKVNIYRNEQLIIDVIDEGVGVPDEIKEKLGDPFFTTKETGTGLGLMVTKNILENHGCTLSIHNNKERGSIFRITFP
ncbi:ATP-binding protein [Bacillaceae bacterium W0354]